MYLIIEYEHNLPKRYILIKTQEIHSYLSVSADLSGIKMLGFVRYLDHKINK